MRSFTSGGKITKKKLFPQIILSIYSWDLGRQVWGPNPNESLSVAGVMNGFWGLYKREATFCHKKELNDYQVEINNVVLLLPILYNITR